MPGVHLNHIEDELKKKWGTDAYSSALEAIEIQGKNGLRGISGVEVTFQYPVTVICGRNGVGKTTLLSLAALAFHAKPGFHAKGTSNSKKQLSGSYYTFQDFFYKGPKDPDYTGLSITWKYRNGKTMEITKRSEKWMHYERRTPKAVQFLSTSRIVNAIEQRGLRSKFKQIDSSTKAKKLNEKFLKHLSYILEREYTEAEELTNRDSQIRTCQGVSSYSSFNMGAGEDVIIELLSIIQDMPDDSLLIIEEIEIGIYPAALTKLAHVLLEIAEEKRMQIIISSHSSDFIDSLPRCARILIERFGANTQIIPSPSTSYAINQIGKNIYAELQIICEDRIADKIITASLNSSLRKRVHISCIGSSSTLALAERAIKKANPKTKTLIVWDGDVSNDKARKFIQQAYSDDGKASNQHEPNYIFLHKNGTPENNIVDEIQHSEESLAFLSDKLGTNIDQTKSIIANIKASSNYKHHDYAYRIAQEVLLEVSQVVDALISSARIASKITFDNIAMHITSVLENDHVDSHNR